MTFILIADDILMFFIHTLFIMLMAGKTGKFSVIVRNMAIRAGGLGMFSSSKREPVVENSL